MHGVVVAPHNADVVVMLDESLSRLLLDGNPGIGVGEGLAFAGFDVPVFGAAAIGSEDQLDSRGVLHGVMEIDGAQRHPVALEIAVHPGVDQHPLAEVVVVHFGHGVRVLILAVDPEHAGGEAGRVAGLDEEHGLVRAPERVSPCDPVEDLVRIPGRVGQRLQVTPVLVGPVADGPDQLEIVPGLLHQLVEMGALAQLADLQVGHVLVGKGVGWRHHAPVDRPGEFHSVPAVEIVAVGRGQKGLGLVGRGVVLVLEGLDERG